MNGPPTQPKPALSIGHAEPHCNLITESLPTDVGFPSTNVCMTFLASMLLHQPSKRITPQNHPLGSKPRCKCD